MAAERRGISVRARATAGGTVAVLIALTVAAVGFVAALDRTLVGSASTQADVLADDLAVRIEASGVAAIPSGTGDALLQLQRDGQVVARTEDTRRAPFPVSETAQRVRYDGDDYLVRSEELSIRGIGYTIVVARSLEVADQADATSTGLLIAAVPMLSLLVGVLIWLLTGRALRPVERVRTEVDALGPGELSRRLTPPGTGDEIDRLVGTMNRMLARLEESERAQRAFVSDASHELRSPIATIRQHAELIQLHPDAEDPAEFVRIVDAESTRLEELVGSLLFLARLDERHRPGTEEVDLDDLALEELRRIRAWGTGGGSAGIHPARVIGDRAALARAVRNLVDNALRHARTRVQLSTDAEGEDVVIRVDDDGPGIPATQREAVFRRFVRLDESRTRDDGGSGLGLAIVAEVATRHGGRVSASESPLGGARFELRLPSAPPGT